MDNCNEGNTLQFRVLMSYLQSPLNVIFAMLSLSVSSFESFCDFFCQNHPGEFFNKQLASIMSLLYSSLVWFVLDAPPMGLIGLLRETSDR